MWVYGGEAWIVMDSGRCVCGWTVVMYQLWRRVGVGSCGRIWVDGSDAWIVGVGCGLRTRLRTN